MYIISLIVALSICFVVGVIAFIYSERNDKWIDKAHEYESFFRWHLIGVVAKGGILEARLKAHAMDTVSTKRLAQVLKFKFDLKNIYPVAFHDVIDRLPSRLTDK